MSNINVFAKLSKVNYVSYEHFPVLKFSCVLIYFQRHLLLDYILMYHLSLVTHSKTLSVFLNIKINYLILKYLCL